MEAKPRDGRQCDYVQVLVLHLIASRLALGPTSCQSERLFHWAQRIRGVRVPQYGDYSAISKVLLGMWRRVSVRVVPYVSEDGSVIIFRAQAVQGNSHPHYFSSNAWPWRWTEMLGTARLTTLRHIPEVVLQSSYCQVLCHFCNMISFKFFENKNC
jgi:hypothetical protein